MSRTRNQVVGINQTLDGEKFKVITLAEPVTPEIEKLVKSAFPNLRVFTDGNQIKFQSPYAEYGIGGNGQAAAISNRDFLAILLFFQKSPDFTSKVVGPIVTHLQNLIASKKENDFLLDVVPALESTTNTNIPQLQGEQLVAPAEPIPNIVTQQSVVSPVVSKQSQEPKETKEEDNHKIQLTEEQLQTMLEQKIIPHEFLSSRTGQLMRTPYYHPLTGQLFDADEWSKKPSPSLFAKNQSKVLAKLPKKSECIQNIALRDVIIAFLTAVKKGVPFIIPDDPVSLEPLSQPFLLRSDGQTLSRDSIIDIIEHNLMENKTRRQARRFFRERHGYVPRDYQSPLALISPTDRHPWEVLTHNGQLLESNFKSKNKNAPFVFNVPLNSVINRLDKINSLIKYYRDMKNQVDSIVTQNPKSPGRQ